MDAQFFIDEAFDAGLETIFQTVFTSRDAVVNGAAGEVLMGENQGVHFGMNREIIFHRAFAQSHFRFIGVLDHAIIAEGDDAFFRIDDHAAHFRRRVLRLRRDRFRDLHKIFVPPVLLLVHRNNYNIVSITFSRETLSPPVFTGARSENSSFEFSLCFA